MPQPIAAALILCPADSRPERRLLGLRVGERVLLALAAEGVRTVAFVGDGPRPACGRAELEVVPVAELLAAEPTEGAWLVTCDSVFDRWLLGARERVSDQLPLTFLTRARLADLIADESAQLAHLSAGRAHNSPGFALRVVDERSYKLARRLLLRSLRKPIDGLVSRHLNRHVSTFISSYLVRTGARPNHLTLAFMVIGLSSGVFAACAEYWWALVLAGFLVQLQSILDGCDGEIARLTYRFSHLGQWLDSIGDDLTNYAFCLGLAVGQARVLECPELYVAGAVTLAAQLLASGVLYRRMLAMGTGDLLAIPDLSDSGSDSLWARLVRSVRVLFKRDTFVFALAALTAAQQPLLAFVIFSAGTGIMLVGVILNERQLRRQLPGG